MFSGVGISFEMVGLRLTNKMREDFLCERIHYHLSNPTNDPSFSFGVGNLDSLAYDAALEELHQALSRFVEDAENDYYSHRDSTDNGSTSVADPSEATELISLGVEGFETPVVNSFVDEDERSFIHDVEIAEIEYLLILVVMLPVVWEELNLSQHQR